MVRRKYSLEFKQSAVQLVREREYTVVEASKSLGVDASSIRWWLKKFPVNGSPAATEGGLRAEIRQLRAENKRLLMEREILKKATAFFARHPS
jgi:transposase